MSDIFTNPYTAYSATPGVGDWIVRIDLDDLDAAAGTLTIRATVAGRTVNGGSANRAKDLTETTACIFVPITAAAGEAVVVTVQSNLAADSAGVTVASAATNSVRQTIDAGSSDHYQAIANTNLKIADTTGNWATAGTWAGGVVPTEGDNIIIRNGVTVTVAANLDLGQFGTLQVQGSGVLTIAEGVTVARVPVGWTVAENNGTVTTNFGTVTINDGTITSNNGTVTINDGTITDNSRVSTVTTNYETITTNNGTVVKNSGTVATNYGTITFNCGMVTYHTSYGTITFNHGTVTYHASYGTITFNYGTVTTNEGPIQFTQTSTSLAAIAAQTDQFNFSGDRVKAISPPTSGAIGGDKFLMDLIIESADGLIIESSDETDDGVLEGDRIKTTHTHTEASIGTQWQATISVLQHDPAYTELIGDPVVTFSSSDESVATVDAAGQVHYIDDGTCRIIAVSAAIGTSPSQRVEVEITNSHEGGQETFRYTYVDDPGSVREDATAAVDDRIVVGGKEKAIFSTQDHATPAYVRNTDCWAADLDLTCISPWNSTGAGQRAGTLISPRHIVFAYHYRISVGATIRFVDGDNNVVNRTVTARQRIGTTDLMIGVLDANATGCGFAKVLPADWADYIPNNGIYIPALALDQQEKALVTNGNNIGGVYFRVPTDVTRLTFYESLIFGDSGNPGFLIIDGDLVVLTVWTYGGAGSGASVAGNKTDIEAAMVSLGGGYNTLAEIDLSGFNTYE